MLYLSSPGGKNGLNHRNSCQKFRQKPTLFALLISLLFAPPVFAADIVYDGTNTGMLRPNPEVSNNTANSLFPDRKSTRLNSSHRHTSRMPSSA